MIDIERYLFLASAIAGRRLSVHLAVRGETRAFSDGQSIIIPADDGRPESLLRAEVVAQAALIAVGALDAVQLRQLIGRSKLQQRFVYLEVIRASRQLADRLPWPFTALPEIQQAIVLTDSASASMALALSAQRLPETPAYFGSIRPLMALRRAVGQEGLSALTRKQQQGEFQQKEVDELDDEDEGEESKILKLFSSPLGSGNALADLLNKLMGAGRSKGSEQKASDGEGGAEMPVGRIERALRRGVNAVLANLPFQMPDIDLSAESQTLSYPEWDVHQKAYRPDWVFVEEVEPWRPDGAQEVGDALQAPPIELRRQLASLGLDHEMHRRQAEGTDLDVGALLDCAIELRTGHSPASTNIYRASRRTRRDLAVVIVLDISGSTAEKDGFGVSIFGKQMQLAYQLAHVLNTLGDTVAMFGFHSWGRKLVRVVRLKGHEERWGGQVADRMALLEPVGYTRTGTAIRHGTRLLRSSVRLPNRLLVLITDGIAYDQDYEQVYAEADARKALEESKALGTACVCLSVGAAMQTDKLVEIFGAANILAVDEVAQMTPKIREVCRKAIASVSQRKLQKASA